MLHIPQFIGVYRPTKRYNQPAPQNILSCRTRLAYNLNNYYSLKCIDIILGLQ